MSEAKQGHTPGPWSISPFVSWRVDANADGRIGPNAVAEASRGHSDAVVKANAHLIAAAPDLLEACETAKMILERCFSDAPGDVQPDSEQRLARQVCIAEKIARLKAAIAKAQPPATNGGEP